METFNSSRTSRQLCTRTSLHISFLRSEKRVGNAGELPDSDVKTEAIEPSSFGLRAEVYVDLSEACWYVHGSDALRTRARGARYMEKINRQLLGTVQCDGCPPVSEQLMITTQACAGNGVWQRRLATGSGNDFGPCHSERLISLFQNIRRPVVDLIGVGSTCMCDAACYHGIAS